MAGSKSRVRLSVLRDWGRFVLTIGVAFWFAYGTPVHVNQPQQHLHLHETDGMSEQDAVLQLLSHRHSPAAPSLITLSFLPALAPGIVIVTLVLIGLASIAFDRLVVSGRIHPPTHGPPRPAFL